MEQIIPSNYLKKKANEIWKIIRPNLKQQKKSLNKFQKISRKLHHASFGMPGGWGFFNPTQQAMEGITPFIILEPSIKKFLRDWRSIVAQLSTQPTSVLQLVH